MIQLSELRKLYEKIVIWGAGDSYQENYVHGLLDVDYLVDSNAEALNMPGMEVFQPERLLREQHQERVAVLVCSQSWSAILRQSKAMGIQCDFILLESLIPDPLSQREPFHRAYALFAEDAIIAGMSERYHIPIRHYLDIGASHPFYGNATFLFYERGASGILVEPIDYRAELLREYRPKDFVIEGGVSGDDENGEKRKFWRIADLDTRSTFSHEVAMYYSDMGMRCEESEIQVRSLNSIVTDSEYPIDYISIDVEGYEYIVLKDFDFQRHKVSFLNIEKGGDERIKKLLLNNGYEVVAETYSNWVFAIEGIVREEF